MKNSKIATYTGRFVLLVAILIMAAGPFIYLRYSQFLTRAKQLKADGVLVSLDDLVYQVIDPQDDALTYLNELIPVANELVKSIGSDHHYRPILKSNGVDEFEQRLAQHPNFFENFSKAAAATDISSSWDENEKLRYSVVDLQNVIQVMRWRGHDLLVRGKHTDSVKVALELLQLSKRIKRSALIDAMLCRTFHVIAFNMLYDTLTIGELDEVTLAMMREELNRLDLDNLYPDSLRSELSLTLQLAAGNDSSNLNFLSRMLLPISLAFEGNRILDQFEVAIESSKLPLTQQFPNTSHTGITYPTSITEQTSFFNSLRNSFGQSKVQRQCLFILMALVSNEDAVDREDWSAEYLESIGVAQSDIIDPFSQLPMKIRRQTDRWVIYSVGPNQQDDNKSRRSDDFGLGWLDD